MSEVKKQRRFANPYFITIVILLIALISIGGYLLYSHLNEKKNLGNSGNVDGQATEWDDGLNAPSEIEGRILIPGYSGASMQEGSKTLEIRIGNPKENNCYLQASFQLEDGTVLYESGLIEPGKGFDEIELTQSLDAGTYEAFIHYQGYSLEDEPELLNSCDSAFTLTVTE